VRLLEDDTLALDLVKRGRRVVDANYQVETQLPQLEQWLQPERVGPDRQAAPAATPVRKTPTWAESPTIHSAQEVTG
jgi:hypothetical protein